MASRCAAALLSCALFFLSTAYPGRSCPSISQFSCKVGGGGSRDPQRCGDHLLRCNNSSMEIRFGGEGLWFRVVGERAYFDYNQLEIEDPILSPIFRNTHCDFLYGFPQPGPLFAPPQTLVPSDLRDLHSYCNPSDYGLILSKLIKGYKLAPCTTYDLYFRPKQPQDLRDRVLQMACLPGHSDADPTFIWNLSMNNSNNNHNPNVTFSIISAGFSAYSRPVRLCFDCEMAGGQCDAGSAGQYRCGFLKRKKIQWLVITFATLGAVMISLGFLGVFLKRKCLRKGERKKKGALLYRHMKFPSLLPGGENVADPPLLHFSDVLAATETFSPANKLGEGGFGPVYKGRLPNGDVVAVKRLSKCSGQGLLEFRNEVELIARLQHKNIVQLLGWCLHEDEKILIYEYLPNRSLDKFIFDPTRAIELNWEKRFHIIKDIAQGLLYLHQHSRLHIVHRDLKTSNILLDAAMNAKISDFGLARMFRGSQVEANTDRIVGTYGYMSPEYALDGHFSDKSDVFSFGVILLEIISGRRNTGFYPYKESLNLLGHAWKLWNEGRGLELLDPSLGDSCPMKVVSRCMHVSLICIQEVAAARPTTSEIVGMLGAEINASLPTPKQPAFFMEHESYGGVPTNGSINFLTISPVESR